MHLRMLAFQISKPLKQRKNESNKCKRILREHKVTSKKWLTMISNLLGVHWETCGGGGGGWLVANKAPDNLWSRDCAMDGNGDKNSSFRSMLHLKTFTQRLKRGIRIRQRATHPSVFMDNMAIAPLLSSCDLSFEEPLRGNVTIINI